MTRMSMIKNSRLGMDDFLNSSSIVSQEMVQTKLSYQEKINLI